MLALAAGAGCGDDATCPSGTTGSPCRYTTGVGDAPTTPEWDAGPTVDDDAANPDATDDAVPSDTDVVPAEPDDGADADDGQVGGTSEPGADHTTPNLHDAVELSPGSAAFLSEPERTTTAPTRDAKDA